MNRLIAAGIALVFIAAVAYSIAGSASGKIEVVGTHKGCDIIYVSNAWKSGFVAVCR